MKNAVMAALAALALAGCSSYERLGPRPGARRCPYHGERPELVRDADGAYRMACERPGCRVNESLRRGSETPEEAVRVWNRWADFGAKVKAYR